MVYLRGSTQKARMDADNKLGYVHSARPRSKRIETRLRHVEALARRTIPELQHFRTTENVTAAATGVQQVNLDPVAALRASGTYRENVLGDKFTLSYFKLNLHFQELIRGCRVIIYKPKKGNDSITLTGGREFVETLDPTQFTVYEDRIIDEISETGFLSYQGNMRLNNAQVHIDGSTIISGDLRVAIVYQTNNITTVTLSTGYRLGFRNM